MRVRSRFVTIVACLATMAAAPVPLVSAQDLDAVRERRAELQQRLDTAAEELAALEAHAGQLSTEHDALTAELDRLGVEIAAADERTDHRVRTLFKRGHVDPMMALLSTERPSEALDRATVIISLTRGDQAASQTATANRIQAQAVRQRLDERRAELDRALSAQQAAQQALRADLQEAAALERRLEEERRRAEEEARREAEEEARQQAAVEAARRARQRQESRSTTRTASQPVASGRYACPVAQPRSFTDTWGAPRSGGRRHRGTDILAPYGTPVLAVTDGVVNIKGYGSSAGNWLIFRGADGTDYWYMHLQSFTVGNGARVSAGTQIGTNGDTGNARGTPHVHFEQHPGGGGAVNPYPFLRRIC